MYWQRIDISMIQGNLRSTLRFVVFGIQHVRNGFFGTPLPLPKSQYMLEEPTFGVNPPEAVRVSSPCYFSVGLCNREDILARSCGYSISALWLYITMPLFANAK